MEVKAKIKVNSRNLAHIYTPGVAEIVRAIMKDRERAYDLTWKGRTVAIVSDGSAILGIGNQGPEPALPVMEAKAVLFKELGGVDAVPIVLNSQNPHEIVKIVAALAPTFGGINLEDIAAPNCFIVESELKKMLPIPVFHDDQWGTAIVVLAGMINALSVVGKKIDEVKIMISGAGAAGIAVSKLLLGYGARHLIVCDSKGPIYSGRKTGMNFAKDEIAAHPCSKGACVDMTCSMRGMDVFIGLSKGGLLRSDDIKDMNEKAIVFALANPIPEIMPAEAVKGGAMVVATGRSDFPNQINNALAFPGVFQGALRYKTKDITEAMKIECAKRIARLIKKPTASCIIPKVMDRRVVATVAGVFRKKHR